MYCNMASSNTIMGKHFKRWIIRLAVMVLIFCTFFVVIVLNPTLTYANKTTHNNFIILHNKPLDTAIFFHLDKALELLKTSEYYNPEVKLNVCLKDGSMYPELIQKIFGNAYAWGFYNNIVIKASIISKNNYVVLNGFKWNLDQFHT